jgi:phosphate transport system substrate-binding protein
MLVMVKRNLALALLLALIVPVIAACGNPQTGTNTGATAVTQPLPTGDVMIQPTGGATGATAVTQPLPTGDAVAQPTGDVLVAKPTDAAGGSAGGAASGKLTLAGSSALLPLMQAAAEQFQAKNPGAQITVTAGGSGKGRSQVCQGQIDIGNSDVPLSDKEKTELNCADGVETAVAVQAFAPVANKKGPGSVTSLTKDQLVGIFSGAITNWKDVGGDDQEIVLINRLKGSGTRSQMGKFLFGGDDTKFATGASEEDNSQTVLTTVSQTPGAISYLSFSYLSNPDILALSVDGVAPTKADIQNGTWKIGGPGYAITKGQPGPLAKAFLDFVTSDEFQKSEAFTKAGVVPVK